MKVLGSLNIDFTVRVPGLPAAGETVIGDVLTVAPGGKGANQACAAARLGASVSLFGRVGNDEFGRTLLSASVGDHVDVSGVLIDPSRSTGAALIVVEASGQNIIAVARGANAAVSDDDAARLSTTIAPGDVVCFQLEVPVDAIAEAAIRSRHAGAVTILNAAPSHPLSGVQMPMVDVLIVNESEASDLSGIRVADLQSAERAARRLKDRAASVAVTMGESGALLLDHGSPIRIEPFIVKAIDATGAGDAFVGGLAVGLASGLSLADSSTIGCAAGAAAVTKLGARSSLPTAADLFDIFGIRVGHGAADILRRRA